jgi:hypothetical protein
LGGLSWGWVQAVSNRQGFDFQGPGGGQWSFLH